MHDISLRKNYWHKGWQNILIPRVKIYLNMYLCQPHLVVYYINY